MLFKRSIAGYFKLWSLGVNKNMNAWIEGKPGIESPWWFLIAL